MPRYAAFLRGISPMNAKMSDLKRCFEAAGFDNVRTLLTSGNVVFDARKASEATLQQKAERAMQAGIGRTFLTIVRPVDRLRELIDADPFADHRLTADSKRIVTFLREPPVTKLALPITLHGASILRVEGSEMFGAYVPGPEGPVFMTLIEKTFGKNVTTRTWDTVRKVAAA